MDTLHKIRGEREREKYQSHKNNNNHIWTYSVYQCYSIFLLIYQEHFQRNESTMSCIIVFTLSNRILCTYVMNMHAKWNNERISISKCIHIRNLEARFVNKKCIHCSTFIYLTVAILSWTFISNRYFCYGFSIIIVRVIILIISDFHCAHALNMNESSKFFINSNGWVCMDFFLCVYVCIWTRTILSNIK